MESVLLILLFLYFMRFSFTCSPDQQMFSQFSLSWKAGQRLLVYISSPCIRSLLDHVLLRHFLSRFAHSSYIIIIHSLSRCTHYTAVKVLCFLIGANLSPYRRSLSQLLGLQASWPIFSTLSLTHYLTYLLIDLFLSRLSMRKCKQ